MSPFIILWFIVTIIIILAIIFWIGWTDRDPLLVMPQSICIAVVWPFALAIGVALTPFVGIYYLSKYLKTRFGQ